jgi:hypothetical protein
LEGDIVGEQRLEEIIRTKIKEQRLRNTEVHREKNNAEGK